jgi:hypothetical protein
MYEIYENKLKEQLKVFITHIDKNDLKKIKTGIETKLIIICFVHLGLKFGNYDASFLAMTALCLLSFSYSHELLTMKS